MSKEEEIQQKFIACQVMSGKLFDAVQELAMLLPPKELMHQWEDQRTGARVEFRTGTRARSTETIDWFQRQANGEKQ